MTGVFAPDSNALITGAASGIGLTIAKLCRTKGMRLCLVDCRKRYPATCRQGLWDRRALGVECWRGCQGRPGGYPIHSETRSRRISSESFFFLESTPFFLWFKARPSRAIVITGSKQGIKHLSWDLSNDKTSLHLLVPCWTFTGLLTADMIKQRREGPKARPSLPEQVADHLYQKMAEDKSYVICPDNDVSEETDKRRMFWTVSDIVEERPPLTRWREEWK
ncbi:hypothetical protein L249_4652 [Ophiocordyceps polyrhachis-furcata BCC 54312]|uniref:Uncharacterized protein n=1 Tax=Ophiocordyceps polyrhachis-furcata BCC 54312 TaxID=1330021 RepID=A0A367L2Z2_9HYPO|nr:hypothetical protein L249_4652 [Ophiocordyceps polyrhachis-furcata BCC 54312]